MDKAHYLFESYNMAIEYSYERFFATAKNPDPLRINEEELAQYINNDITVWANSPLSELQDLSPAAYIESISDLETLICLFRLGANLCDKDVPSVLVNQIRLYGEAAEIELLSIIGEAPFSMDDEDFFIKIMAIKILGSWESRKAIGPLMNLLRDADTSETSEEMVVEEVVQALAAIGQPAIPQIIDYIDNAKEYSFIYEHLLYTLVKISAGDKNEQVYKCLKNAFLNMDDKVIGAICLGDYGDSRAIPALRGYVEKNKTTIDYETFCEIKSAVNRLGGNMDDMKFDKTFN